VHTWVGVHLPDFCVEKKSSLLASQVAQGIFSAVSLLVCFVEVLSGIGKHLSTWLWTECLADF